MEIRTTFRTIDNVEKEILRDAMRCIVNCITAGLAISLVVAAYLRSILFVFLAIMFAIWYFVLMLKTCRYCGKHVVWRTVRIYGLGFRLMPFLPLLPQSCPRCKKPIEGEADGVGC